jgi:radical SAM protein with 4Fe4S-binding SPASM domain
MVVDRSVIPIVPIEAYRSKVFSFDKQTVDCVIRPMDKTMISGGASGGQAYAGSLSAWSRTLGWALSFSLVYRKVLPRIGFRALPFYILVRSAVLLLPVRVLANPYFMQIEPTTRCDLSCRFCPREHLPIKGEDLTLDTFRRIIDHNPFVVAVLLQGLGEPLLHPEIEGMIRYGRSKRIFMGICTNGMALTADRFERLTSSGLNYLAISVDGTGEAFEAMRNGARFDLLIERLSEIKNKGIRGGLMAFWMRLCRQNFDQVLPVLDLARAFGVAHVHFQDLQYKHDAEYLHDLSLSSFLNGSGMSTFLASARRQAARRGIVTTFDPMDRHQKRTHCTWPWEKMYIDCRGDVWPCCVAWERDYAMGNLLASSLSEVWKGSRYRNFRRALRDGPLPMICRECRFL